MSLSPVLLVHICAATVGLLSGYSAMFFRKGSGPHGAAGTIFVISMLCMSSTGAYYAAFVHPNMLNVVVALLTFYLVATAWWTAKRRVEGTGAFDVVALLFILAVGVAGMTFGFEAADSPTGTKDRMPAFIYFFFGSMALLSAVLDIRMIARGGVGGGKRIARHLLRMCFALLIATFSLYPGQAKLFPTWLRETNLLFVPHILLLGSMIFWTVRVRARKREQRQEVIVVRHGDAIATSA